jgi:hypothetical protein
MKHVSLVAWIDGSEQQPTVKTVSPGAQAAVQRLENFRDRVARAQVLDRVIRIIGDEQNLCSSPKILTGHIPIQPWIPLKKATR